jgi:hypothetical protein
MLFETGIADKSDEFMNTVIFLWSDFVSGCVMLFQLYSDLYMYLNFNHVQQ